MEGTNPEASDSNPMASSSLCIPSTGSSSQSVASAVRIASELPASEEFASASAASERPATTKRPREEEKEEGEEERAATDSRSAADAGSGAGAGRGEEEMVRKHYNGIRDAGVQSRQGSQILRLRDFQNWVKAKLLERAYTVAGERGGRRDRVLDLCCGKGGDLHKHYRNGAAYVAGFDIAEGSIADACARVTEMQRTSWAKHPMQVELHACDVFSHPVAPLLRQPAAEFDIVSCQFAAHYAFSDEAHVRMLLRNVSERLRVGGVFAGTTLSSDAILNAVRASPDRRSYRNSICSIKFDSSVDTLSRASVYGVRYYFWLVEAVDNVPEYLVHLDSFANLAAEYGLKLLSHPSFRDVRMSASDHDRRYLASKGCDTLSDDEGSTAYFYFCFIFQKMSEPRLAPDGLVVTADGPG
jgi:mRNA (guanine-N7-)-methyltransferase